MRQKCATQEVDAAQITLGSLQNDLTYARREIFELRTAVEEHIHAAQYQAEWIRKHKLEIDEMKRINDNVTDESKQRDLEHRVAMSKLTDNLDASKQIAEDSAAEYQVLLKAAGSSEDKAKQSEQYAEKLRALVSELQQQQQTGLGQFKAMSDEHAKIVERHKEEKEKQEKWYYTKTAEANAATSKAEAERERLQQTLELERRDHNVTHKEIATTRADRDEKRQALSSLRLERDDLEKQLQQQSQTGAS